MLGYAPMLGSTDTNPPEVSQDIAKEQMAQAAWNNAVAALDYAVPHVAEIGAAVAKLSAEGKWSGKMDNAIDAWVKSVESLLGAVTKVLTVSPTAMSTIDTIIAANSAAPSVVPGAWQELVANLQPALPANVAGLGFWQPVLSGAARVLTNPATWKGVAEVLKKVGPYVGAWIVGDQVVKVSDNVAATLGTGAKQVQENGKVLDVCLAALNEATTLEEKAAAERLCTQTIGTPNTVGWLVLGGLAAGVGYLCWKNRDRIQVQSPVRLAGFSPRGRRRHYVGR